MGEKKWANHNTVPGIAGDYQHKITSSADTNGTVSRQITLMLTCAVNESHTIKHNFKLASFSVKFTALYGNPNILYRKLDLVYICAIVSLYQINTDRCTHMLLKHHFIHTICHSNMFQPLKGHLQGV